MHITAYCPSCRSRYQLDPGLRGQRMRCPNPLCREVFEVQESQPREGWPNPPGAESMAAPQANLPSEAAHPPDPHMREDGVSQGTGGESASGVVRTTGTVGDLLQILDAEVVHETPAPPASSDPAPTAADVHEAVPISPEENEEAMPIPVEESLLPPPIEVERLIPLEPEEEGRAQPAVELPSWHVPPPVRNPMARTAGSQSPEGAAPIPSEPPSRTAKSKSPGKKPPPVKAPAPEDVPPSWEAVPPIRRRDRESFSEAETGAPRLEPEPIPDMGLTPSHASRRALWVIAAMVVVAGFLIASVTVMTLNAYVQTEAKRHEQAKRDYDEGRFASAANAYQNLVNDFPNSENHTFYQLMAQWCQVRDQVYAAATEPEAALTAMQTFLKTHQSDPLLKPYKKDIGQTLAKLAEQLIVLAQERSDPALLAAAKHTLELSGRYHPSSDNRAASEKIVLVERQIHERQRKEQLLGLLSRWLHGRPSVEVLKMARDRARRAGLGQDPQIKGLVNQMEKALAETVRYVPNRGGTPELAPATVETSLRIVPVIKPAHPSTALSRRAVLALVRGVLYALDPSTGQDLWALRVGIDTATLPVRLPATPASPELLLVLSADRNTIMALEPWTGVLAWRHHLSARCLGRPVVVGRKAFVPTLDGRIYEIETAKGNVLGHFELHQPLTVGGVQQLGTDLLYFPGDSDYLYVLNVNVKTKKCVAILHTGHPSGSLRSEPIVVNRTDPFAKRGEANKTPSYLVLAQNDGLDHMRLRVFELPIENPEPAPLLKADPRSRGWSWFRPYHDGERLAFVTDAGIFSLFGIQQVGNQDDPIFPELPETATEPKELSVRAETRLLRGQVVHVADNDFWILANGMLQRIHFDPFGPRTLPVWDQPLPLGSPEHSSQFDDSTKTLFVVSQDLSRQLYLATAVAARDGTIRWQRQLGLECQGDPLVLGRDVITLDRGGGLCVFDGGKSAANREWRRTDPSYAPALSGGPIVAALLPTPDGGSVYEVACSASTGKLTVRHYKAGRAGEKPQALSEETVELPSPLAGTPALVGQSLLLPLANGAIRRFPLPLTEGTAQGGPDWRAVGADDDARGHIVALSADEFITTNGSRGLTHWQWRQSEQTFQMIPMDRAGPTVELPARIVSAPVVLSAAQAGALCQVCVADSQGNITLLSGPDLSPQRTWSLQGKITAGPFRRGQHLGCVVDRSRLVWLDPAKAGTLWEYRSRAEGIVGQPQLVGDMVVVADLSGRLIGLDPATGKPRGPIHTLKAAAAPAATPVSFGPDTAFVALTDGTAVLLPLRQLRDPLAALPSLGP